jgi:hypothetical protein
MKATTTGKARERKRLMVDLTPRTTNEVEGGRDAASGMATGKRSQTPLTYISETP